MTWLDPLHFFDYILCIAKGDLILTPAVSTNAPVK